MNVIQVAAGIVARNGHYLIAKRKRGVHLAGLWEFPGGKREEGESLEACLAREFHEELGVGVRDAALFETVRHRYPEKTVELHFFRCEIDGEPHALGCEEYRWVSPDDFGRYSFPPADRPIIERLMHDRWSRDPVSH